MNLTDLVHKYRKRGLVIDTNLLLLLIVGLYDKNFINQFRRLVKYEIEDFQRISNFVSKFKKIIITPHILTELSNLSFNITEPKLSSYLQKFVRVLKNFHEESLDKNTILKLDLFAKLGVTDSAFIEIAKDKKYLVITDDLDAYANMLKLRIDAINYSHFKYLLNETR